MVTDSLKVVDSPGANPSEPAAYVQSVSTTLPQAQIYSANYLSGQLDKYGHPMNERDAICIETQNMPDSIHKEEKPTVILKKGKVYDETTTYTFGIR